MIVEKRTKTQGAAEKEVLCLHGALPSPGASHLSGSATLFEGSSWNSDCEQDLFSFPDSSGRSISDSAWFLPRARELPLALVVFTKGVLLLITKSLGGGGGSEVNKMAKKASKRLAENIWKEDTLSNVGRTLRKCFSFSVLCCHGGYQL